LGLHFWLSSDGHARGILTFTGPIPTDLVEAFTSRWPIRMRVIEVEELRVAIYNALKPSVISHARGSRAEARLSIWPRRLKRLQPRTTEWDDEALPVLVG
jgi:hypothetical protein